MILSDSAEGKNTARIGIREDTTPLRKLCPTEEQAEDAFHPAPTLPHSLSERR